LSLSSIYKERYFAVQILVGCLLLLLSLGGCKAPSKVSGYTSLKGFFKDPSFFENAFTGFVLYDPQTDKILFNQHGDKYFTPASNTKIFTLYTAMKVLGDSMPSLRFLEKEDTVFFWPMADPTWLHPDFPGGHRATGFLDSWDKHLSICLLPTVTPRFGPGWAWDDYRFSYQVERTSMPLYANRVWISYDSLTRQVNITPGSLDFRFFWDAQETKVTRGPFSNDFVLSIGKGTPSFSRTFPLHMTDDVAADLLEKRLRSQQLAMGQAYPLPENGNTFYTESVDTVYRLFMQQSDNFIAEQLLQVCAAMTFDTFDIDRMIEFAKDHFLGDLTDDPLWYDGSGLSRYNMFTPRTIIQLLTKLYREKPEDWLFSIFPAGGRSGTIVTWYSDQEPFVFAKTGTLRNNHCLSGYLKTDQGRTLIFSFMHNHYPGSSQGVKKSMDQVLRFIKKKF